MAVPWRITVFQIVVLRNPHFYSVFWVRVFWAKLSKKEIWTPTKRLSDNWKASLWYSWCFLFYFFVFVFFCLCFLATSLDPKPSLFVFCGGGVVFCCVFFGGFKGQMRWPEGPPLFLFRWGGCFCLSFLCFFNTIKLVFPLEKGIFLFLSFSLCFSLAVVGLPLFQFFFLSLSLVFFVFFWFLLFVSFFPFVYSLLLFHERNNIKTFNCNFCFINHLFFGGFLSCFSFKSLFIFVFSWY